MSDYSTIPASSRLLKAVEALEAFVTPAMQGGDTEILIENQKFRVREKEVRERLDLLIQNLKKVE